VIAKAAKTLGFWVGCSRLFSAVLGTRDRKRIAAAGNKDRKRTAVARLLNEFSVSVVDALRLVQADIAYKSAHRVLTGDSRRNQSVSTRVIASALHAELQVATDIVELPRRVADGDRCMEARSRPLPVGRP
jgi:hypothetical protein